MKNLKPVFLILILFFYSATSLPQENILLKHIAPNEHDKCGYDETLSTVLLQILGDHWGYGYDTLLVDLARWAQSPYVYIDSIGASVQNRALWELKISANTLPLEPRSVVYIHARTHPNEVQSTWVTNEIIKRLLSESAFAQLIREKCVVYVVPMYNPDGVELE
jgi:murein tripeptide amidase MpaA